MNTTVNNIGVIKAPQYLGRSDFSEITERSRKRNREVHAEIRKQIREHVDNKSNYTKGFIKCLATIGICSLLIIKAKSIKNFVINKCLKRKA